MPCLMLGRLYVRSSRPDDVGNYIVSPEDTGEYFAFGQEPDYRQSSQQGETTVMPTSC